MSLISPLRATRSAGSTLNARAISRLPTGVALVAMKSMISSRLGNPRLARFAMASVGGGRLGCPAARGLWLRRALRLLRCGVRPGRAIRLGLGGALARSLLRRCALARLRGSALGAAEIGRAHV